MCYFLLRQALFLAGFQVPWHGNDSNANNYNEKERNSCPSLTPIQKPPPPSLLTPTSGLEISGTSMLLAKLFKL